MLDDPPIYFVVELAEVEEHIFHFAHFDHDEAVFLNEILDGDSAPEELLVHRHHIFLERQSQVFELADLIVEGKHSNNYNPAENKLSKCQMPPN